MVSQILPVQPPPAPTSLHVHCPDAAGPPLGLRPHCPCCLTLSSSRVISGGTTLASPPASRASWPRLLFPGGGRESQSQGGVRQASSWVHGTLSDGPSSRKPPPSCPCLPGNDQSLPPLSQVFSLGGGCSNLQRSAHCHRPFLSHLEPLSDLLLLLGSTHCPGAGHYPLSPGHGPQPPHCVTLGRSLSLSEYKPS